MQSGTNTAASAKRLSEDEAKKADTASMRAAEREDLARQIQAACQGILVKGIADGKSAMTAADMEDYLKAWDAENLEWADTHDKRQKALRDATHYAADFVMKAGDAGQEFLAEVKQAKGKDWNEAVERRWKEQMLEIRGDAPWPVAEAKLKEFLRMTLKELERNWRELDKDLAKIDMLRERTGKTARDLPELAVLDEKDFAEWKYPARRQAVDAALKALLGGSVETDELAALHEEAATFLQDAADAGLLDQAKVKRALKSIFAKGNTTEDIARYIRETLPAYRKQWEAEAQRYDALGKTAMPKSAFVALSFAERQAYLDGAETDARKAKHIAAEPDAKQNVSADDTLRETRKPADVLKSMRQLVATLPPGVRRLYRETLEDDDPKTFLALRAMVENAYATEAIHIEQDDEDQMAAAERIKLGNANAEFIAKTTILPSIEPEEREHLTALNLLLSQDMADLRRAGSRFTMSGEAHS